MREKPRPPVQVFAYDDTLGPEEGRELESLLAYFPASAPFIGTEGVVVGEHLHRRARLLPHGDPLLR